MSDPRSSSASRLSEHIYIVQTVPDTGSKHGYGYVAAHPWQHTETRADFIRSRLSSAAPAHRTRDVDSTFCPDLGAELGQVMLLPDATSHAPHAQPITDNQRATCRWSSEAQCGSTQLQTWSQLCRGTLRLRWISSRSCLEASAQRHTGRPWLTSPCPLGALGRRYECPYGSCSMESPSPWATACRY